MRTVLSRVAFVVGVVLSSLLPAAVADAQETEESQARVHFTSGRQYFDVGEYEDALREFQRAFDLSQRPQLLYNIALCHERLAHYAEAADALERYLQSGAATEGAESLQARVDNLRARAAGAEDTQEGTSQNSSGDGLFIGAMVGLGVGAVGLVLAVTLGVLALDEQSQLDACRPDCAVGSDDGMRGLALGSDIATGVAVAGVGAGVVLLVLSLAEGGSDDSASVAAAPWVSPEGAGVVAGGAW